MRQSKETISSLQFALLLVTLVGGTAFFVLPGAAARVARQDAWLVPLVAAVPGYVAVQLALTLAEEFPGLTLAQCCERVLGRMVGKAIAFLYGLGVLHIGSIVMREVGEFLVTEIMPETPIAVFIALVGLVSGYAARNGIEVIARTNEVVLPIAIFLGIVFLALLVPHANLRNFLPILEQGPMRLLRGSELGAAWRMQLGLMAMITPQADSPGARKGAVAAQWILLTLLFLQMVTIVGSLGPLEAGRATYATFISSELIRYGEFLERIDAIIMSTWIALAALKGAILTYCGCSALGQAFGISYGRLVWPATVITAFASLAQFGDYLALYLFIERHVLTYSITLTIIVPTILLVVGRIRGKGMTGL